MLYPFLVAYISILFL